MALDNLVNMGFFTLFLMTLVAVFVYDWISRKMPDFWQVPNTSVTLGKGLSMFLTLYGINLLAGAVM